MKKEKYTLKDGRELIVPYNRCDVAPITRDLLEVFIAEFDKAHEQAQQLQTIMENLEEIKAKERCRAIDEFLEMVEKDSAERWVEYHEYGITFSDLERIAKDMKGDKNV